MTLFLYMLFQEVFRTPLTNRTNVPKKSRRDERRKTRSLTSEEIKNLVSYDNVIALLSRQSNQKEPDLF